MPFSAQDLSLFNPEIWSQKTEKIFNKKVVMLPLVNRQFESDLTIGDTVHVQKPGNFTISQYTRNNPMTLQQATVTDDTLLINQQPYVYFAIDRLDKKQAKVPLEALYQERAAIAMRDEVDTHLLGHYTDALSTQGSAGSGITLNADNIYDYFCEVNEDLDDQNIDGERHAVITPKYRKLITQSPELRDRGTEMVDANIRNGYMGKFAGFNIHVTTNMSAVSGTYPLMFFSKDFINFAEQLSVTEFENPSGYMVKACKMLKLYGSKVFNPEAGAVIYAN